MYLLEIHLTELNHLGEEFQMAYRNGELLHYLQEEIVTRSNNRLYIFQLVAEDFVKEKKTLVLADKELLKQLEKNYLQATIFSDVMKELVQNSIFSTAVTIDEDWRKRSLLRADHQINEDIMIEEEGL